VNQASRLSGGALETGDVMQIRTTWFAMGLPLVALAAAATAAPPKAIDLPSEHMFPESLSIGTDGTAYLGSMNGGVLRVSMKTGKAEQWIKPAAYGTGALFGVYVDARNHLLWTCTNDFSARGVTVEGSDKGTFLKGFDLRTGAGKISLKLPGEHPICNDMAVAKDGSLYVADTGAPHILRWKPGAAALEIWVEDPVFGPGGLDGIGQGHQARSVAAAHLAGRHAPCRRDELRAGRRGRAHRQGDHRGRSCGDRDTGRRHIRADRGRYLWRLRLVQSGPPVLPVQPGEEGADPGDRAVPSYPGAVEEMSPAPFFLQLLSQPRVRYESSKRS
jgi:hypothetical protein